MFERESNTGNRSATRQWRAPVQNRLRRGMGSAVLVLILAALPGMMAADEPMAQAQEGGTTKDRPSPLPGTGLGNGPAPEGSTLGSSARTLRFALFSDITGGERPGVFEVAAAQLSMLRPDFVVNVGDLIEGADDPAEIHRQWRAFETRADRIGVPVFYTGGNHDLLGPALREAWASRHGPRHYHFLVEDLLFIVLDTDDYGDDRLAEIAALRREAFEVADAEGWDAFADTAYARLPETTGGEISRPQADEVLEILARHDAVRWTFLLMHKAPWRREDNAPWRDIEAALAGRSYTVFHGHEHAYEREVRRGMDHIQLATTGGVPLPARGLAMDQLVWVTVEGNEVHIANLLLGGILDRSGKVPARGHERCFARALCEPAAETRE